MGLRSDFLKRYEFDWDVIDVVIGGKSAIDSEGMLRLRTSEEAHQFLECYGYDIENPIEAAEIFGNFQESLSFIRRYFLKPDNPEGLKLEIPRKIMELVDISQLLLFASSPSDGSHGQALLGLWSCSIMRVMHTLAHIDKDLRTNYYTDIQKQILDKFYKFIHRDEDGQIYLGKENRDIFRVNLVTFESKPKKARDSVILKLLHKPENVAEDIFDRVGIRFVTKNKLDALRIVKFLKDRYVIMPANIKPSRSKNTLVTTDGLLPEINKLIKKADDGKIPLESLDGKIAAICDENDKKKNEDSVNPHTSKHYRAIQFTCRQLIKIRNPIYDELKAIKGALKNPPKSPEVYPSDLVKSIEALDLRNIQKEIRFFYPFEVQILDEQSHNENLAGRSSHVNYKKSQINAAMKRVMGELMRFAENDHAQT